MNSDGSLPNARTYQDKSVQAGVTYYRIRPIHATDTSAFIPEVWVAMPKMKQTISFASIADQKLEEQALQLLATSSSSLPLHWQVVSGSAKVEGNELLFETAGRVILHNVRKKLAEYTLQKGAQTWQAQIRVNHMSAGRYVIVLEDQGKISIKFFTKQ